MNDALIDALAPEMVSLLVTTVAVTRETDAMKRSVLTSGTMNPVQFTLTVHTRGENVVRTPRTRTGMKTNAVNVTTTRSVRRMKCAHHYVQANRCSDLII